MKRFNKNSRNIKILLITFLLILFIIIIFVAINNENIFNKIKMPKFAEEESLQDESQNVTEVQVPTITTDSNGEIEFLDDQSIEIGYITGTAPFDLEEGAGNDTKENDRIVRSFDDIIYTIKTSYKTSSEDMYLFVKASLPEGSQGKLTWADETINSWGTISEDGATFNGKVQIKNMQDSGIEGKNIKLKVLGAENGYEVTPEFYVWIGDEENNEFDSESSKVNIDKITVSATPRYNIALNSVNNDLDKRMKVTLNNQETYGRMYGATVSLQLYNTSITQQDGTVVYKGVKGVEVPNGDITFNLDLRMTKDGAEIEDYSPILWNYRINSADSEWKMTNEINSFSNFSDYSRWVPQGLIGEDRSSTIYNSGNIEMAQNTNLISVTVSDYGFDGIFPSIVMGENIDENIGYFSTIYFQIFVPDSEKLEEAGQYRLYIEDNNIRVNGNSVEQQNSDDDELTFNYMKTKIGQYSHYIILRNVQTNKYLSSKYSTGDGVALVGQEFYGDFTIIQAGSNDEGTTEITKVEKFIKFEGDGIEPVQCDDTGIMFTESETLKNNNLNWNIKFVAKSDGSTWEDEGERNNTVISNENLVKYDSLEQLKNENKTCIGIYLVGEGTIEIPKGNMDNYIRVKFKVKDDAQINKTYGITQDDVFYIIDGRIENIIQDQYEKTQYNMETGEFSGGHGAAEMNNYGQTVLVVAAKPSVKKTAIIEENNSEIEKLNYDLGNNENEVIFKLQPTLSLEENVSPIENATIRLTDTLPKGLTYKETTTKDANVLGPQITNNEDGTTTLIWTIQNCSTQSLINPIKYKAEIDLSVQSNTQLLNKVVIECDKAGTTPIEKRTSLCTITVIDNVSHRFAKTVQDEKIEQNGEISYLVTYLNKTNDETVVRILDILPYNNDERGSNFNGNYTLKSIEIDAEGLSVYTTNKEEVRQDTENALITERNDYNWVEETNLSNINKEVKAIAVQGKVSGKGQVTISFTLTTNGNKEGDVYYNNALANVSDSTLRMNSVTTKTEVIGRSIKGVVWLDENEDGIMQTTESKLPNIEVVLLNEEGNILKDKDGKEIKNTTDENGMYIFESLPKGKYIVKININNYYELTQKNIGEDSKINSKINTETKMSDVISDLDVNATVNLENINAGLKVQKVNITVNKEWIDEDNINGKRPESVILQIKNGTNLVAEKTVTEGDDWSHTFTNLDKYTVQGNEIIYTIDEEEVNQDDLKFYTKTIENNTIINTFTVPDEKTEITVTKKWEDSDNKYNKRPESIELLIKDGEKIVQRQVVKAEDKWAYTFKNLSKYDSKGDEILYTVDESDDNLIYYDKTIEGNTITNTFKVTDETLTSNIVKTANKEEITDENEEIAYNIKYTATIDKYIGNAIVTITDALPYEIDETKSDLNGGTYNKENKTITWTETIENINTFKDEVAKQVSIQKDIKIVYTNYRIDTATAKIENNVASKTLLDTTGKTETKEAKEELILNLKPVKVIVNHYLKGTAEKLAESISIEGKIGEEYKTQADENLLKEYDLVEEPENQEGTFQRENQEVNYYYIKKKGKLIVEYLDKDTKEKLLEDKATIEDVGTDYATEPEEIKYYKLVESEGNTEGAYRIEEQKVVYYYEKLNFNLSVKKTLSSSVINGESETNYEKIGKIEIDSKKVKDTSLKLTYTITVANTGEIAGTCTLVEQIPEGFSIDETSESEWTLKDKNTAQIMVDELEPEEEKAYKITIKCDDVENSLGTIENVAKIMNMSNKAGFDDTNKLDNQDSADFILSIRTGKEINIFIIGICMSLMGLAIIIIGAKIPAKEKIE